MDTKSQETKILAYLKGGKTITPIEALNRFGCFRLGARIFCLRKTNVIDTEIIPVSGGKKHVAQYKWLREK